MAKRLTPCDRILIIDAIRDKLTVLDGITRRDKKAFFAARLASEYRVILDNLKVNWRTE